MPADLMRRSPRVEAPPKAIANGNIDAKLVSSVDVRAMRLEAVSGPIHAHQHPFAWAGPNPPPSPAPWRKSRPTTGTASRALSGARTGKCSGGWITSI